MNCRHGLGRMEYFILNDPSLSFKDILQRHLCGEPLVEKKPEKAERKPEKAEPKVDDEDAELKPRKGDSSKKDKKKAKPEAEADNNDKDKDNGEAKEKEVKKEEKEEKMEVDEEEKTKEETPKKEGKKKKEEKEKEKNKDKEKDNDVEMKKEETTPEKKQRDRKAKAKAEAEAERKKKEDEKSMPAPTTTPERRKISVSIQPPHITLQQMEQMITSGGKYDVELMNDLMAQTYAAAIKWPKDVILLVRLEHVMKFVETGVWPVQKNYPLGDHLLTGSRAGSPEREASTPISELSEVSFEEPSPVRRRRGRQTAHEENPLDHSPKIRSLLTAGSSVTVTPTKNPSALNLDAFLHESNQQNLAEK